MVKPAGLLGLAISVALPATAAALDLTTLRYTCERGVEVPAVYVNDEAEGAVVSLLIEGRLIALLLEPAASGARYAWPSDGSGYVWLTKGETATLLWKDGEAGTETALLSECKVAQ
jgi:membrane-bound inhibitor of C-type lysozyme